MINYSSGETPEIGTFIAHFRNDRWEVVYVDVPRPYSALKRIEKLQQAEEQQVDRPPDHDEAYWADQRKKANWPLRWLVETCGSEQEAREMAESLNARRVEALRETGVVITVEEPCDFHLVGKIEDAQTEEALLALGMSLTNTPEGLAIHGTFDRVDVWKVNKSVHVFYRKGEVLFYRDSARETITLSSEEFYQGSWKAFTEVYPELYRRLFQENRER